MLIKRSIVENWYQRDSWVYKNFAYLFQNSIWNKDIPRGFSVCPYFWLSLFSLVIFRPFILAPIKYVFKPLVRLLGRFGLILDSWFFDLLKMVGVVSKHAGVVSNYSDPRSGTGVMFFVAVLIGSFVLGYGGLYTYKVASSIYANITGSFEGRWAFWWLISFIPITIGLIIHKSVTKTDCKTFNYLWLLFALFFISSAIMIPGAMLTSIWLSISLVIQFFSTVAIGVWVGIVLISKFLWTYIVIAILWNPFSFLTGPILVYIFGITAVAFIITKIFEHFFITHLENIKIHQPETFQEKCRNSWVNLLLSVLNISKYYNSNSAFTENRSLGTISRHKLRAILEFKHDIFVEAVFRYWSNQLKTWQNEFPNRLDLNWKEMLKIENSDERFTWLFISLKIEGRAFMPDAFDQTLADVISSSHLTPLINERTAELEHWEASYKKRKSYLWCQLITNSISSVVHCIWEGIQTLCKNVATFVAYLWILIKAKKQGACPYMVFKDVGLNETNKNTVDKTG